MPSPKWDTYINPYIQDSKTMVEEGAEGIHELEAGESYERLSSGCDLPVAFVVSLPLQ